MQTPNKNAIERGAYSIRPYVGACEINKKIYKVGIKVAGSD
jgi:hypothetical protein